MNGPRAPNPTPTHLPPPLLHVQEQPAGGHGPRFPKLSLPTYEGKEDPLGWLNTCEQFFQGY